MKKIIKQLGTIVAQSAAAYAVNEVCKATWPKIKEAFEDTRKKSDEDEVDRETKRELSSLVKNTKKEFKRRIKEKEDGPKETE